MLCIAYCCIVGGAAGSPRWLNVMIIIYVTDEWLQSMFEIMSDYEQYISRSLAVMLRTRESWALIETGSEKVPQAVSFY